MCPLEEQRMLLAAEPPLWPFYLSFKIKRQRRSQVAFEDSSCGGSRRALCFQERRKELIATLKTTSVGFRLYSNAHALCLCVPDVTSQMAE